MVVLTKPPKSLVITVLIFVSAFEAYYVLVSDPLNFWALPDQGMISIFHDHRAEFEKLRQMAIEDRKNYVGKPGAWKKSFAREYEFNRLTSMIHPGMGVEADSNNSVWFTFAGGISIRSTGAWSKGIVYFPPTVIVEKEGKLGQSLDNARTFPAGVYLRKIEPYWFIVYSRYEPD